MRVCALLVLSFLFVGSFALVLKTPDCQTDDDCQKNEFCASDFRNCDISGGGNCKAIPESCSDEIIPTCGCNGITYDSDCQAATFSISIATGGECAQATASVGTATYLVDDGNVATSDLPKPIPVLGNEAENNAGNGESNSNNGALVTLSVAMTGLVALMM